MRRVLGNTKRTPPTAWTAFSRRGAGPRVSGETNGLGLRALVAGSDLEDDRLALFENLVTGHVDGRVVDEYVLPAPLDGDEPEAFLSVEPLHCAVGHFVLPAGAR